MPYNEGSDPYTDHDTGVLTNLLGIRTVTELEDAESRLTTIGITSLTSQNPPLPEAFDMSLLQTVHGQLFGDIYEWAGELRIVELSKDTTRFTPVEFLEQSMHKLFNELKEDDYMMTTDFDEFVALVAHYYGELIVRHPFREGNGRAIRTFLAMLANSNGWYIAWDEMSAQENIDASIAAYRGDEAPMRKMLSKIITPIDIFWGRDPYEFI